MTPRPDPRLIAASRLVENLAHQIPAARLHIRQQINAIGELRAATYDGPRGGDHLVTVHEPCAGHRRCTWLDCPDVDTVHTHPCRIAGEHTHTESVPVTAVEVAAAQRIDLQNWLDDLEGHASAIAAIAANALRDCERIIGRRVVEVRRCDPSGRDGEGYWGDYGCPNVASRGPLCDKCSKREYRWRQAHGLPSRTDGVYSVA